MTGCASSRKREAGVERHEILEMMSQLKLAGMRGAYDEIVAEAVKRQHPVQRVVGELLPAQVADNRARSIAYRMGMAVPAGEDPRRVRLRRLAGQRGAGARDVRGRLPGNPTQCRAGRRNRLRKIASCHRDRRELRAQRCPRALLQYGRPRQPARSRRPQRQGRETRRTARAPTSPSSTSWATCRSR
jgi:hypothetical protein